MIFRGTYEQARQSFADRFEEADGSFLFRASPRAVPVRVTGTERDEAVAAFVRGIRVATRAMTVALLVGIVIVALLRGERDENTEDWSLWLMTGIVVASYGLGWWWLWTAPNRRFERRSPAGVARSRAEAGRLTLGRVSWGALAFSAIFGGLMMARWSDGERILPAIGAACVVAALVQAIRKLRARV